MAPTSASAGKCWNPCRVGRGRTMRSTSSIISLSSCSGQTKNAFIDSSHRAQESTLRSFTATSEHDHATRGRGSRRQEQQEEQGSERLFCRCRAR